MAEIRIDHLTESVTIPVMAVRDSDGAIWDGVSAFAAPATYTSTALATAVNQAAMTFASVPDGSSAHTGYALTLPAGVAAVACTLYCYDGTFSVGDEARWVYEYDPSIASILVDTGTTLPASIAALPAAIWALAATIDGKTPAEALQIIGAMAGTLSGAGTGTEVLKGLDGSTTRITATVDEDGNRTMAY